MSVVEQKYFYEDEVWRIKKGLLKLGMIVETSEYSSDDDSSDEEEEQIKPGSVRVAWYPLGEEEVIPEKKLSLVDRSLMPGDIVRRSSDKKQSQRGFCRKVHMYSTLEIVGTKQVIIGVPTTELVTLDKYRPDILICKDGWVGIVRDVKSNILLRLPDGSKVSVEDTCASDLEDFFTRKDYDSQFRRYDFYPGQILCGAVQVVENGNWTECSEDVKLTRKNKPMKVYKMTVESIEVDHLTVNWLCRANFGSVKPQENEKQPPRVVTNPDNERVRMLNIYEPITVQMGDRNYYNIKETDAMVTKSEWKKIQMDQLAKIKGVTSSKLINETSKTAEEDGIKVVMSDDNDTTKVQADTIQENSDEYEDCDEDKDTDSTCSDKQGSCNGDSNAKKNRKKHAQPALSTKGFKKKKLKMARSQKESSPKWMLAQVGMRVVTETLCTKSEVEVVWQDGSIDTNIQSCDLYPVQHLDEHEFFPGDFVVESKDGFHPHHYGVIQTVDYVGRCCRVNWYRTYTEGSRPQPQYLESSECSVYDLKEHPDFKFKHGAIVIRVAAGTGEKCGLGAGQVLDLNTDGQVTVWWADLENETEGTTGLCYPQDIYKVGEYDSDDGELWGEDYDEDDEEDDSGDSDDSWSTEIEYEVGEGEEDKDISAGQDQEDYTLNQLLRGFEKVRTELVQPNFCVKNLIPLHTQMTQLDELMGTSFFAESNFDGLVERLREQEKISSVERAVQSHVTRLFSHTEVPSSPSGEQSTSSDHQSAEAAQQPTLIDSECSPVHSSPDKDSGTESFIGSPNSNHTAKDANNDSVLNNTGTNDTSTEDEACIKFKSMLTSQLELAHDVARQRYGDQSIQNFTKIFELCENVLDNVDSELEMLNFIPCDTPVLESKSILDPVDAGSNIVPLTPGSFQTVDFVPDAHKFKLTIFQPRKMTAFVRSIKKEIELLRSSLPSGITMKGFEDRMDLFSAMIEGPKNTPYEDGLFFFDFQLGPDYPSDPPTCNYISYCSDKLNPNLYEDGKVCVSLLGTWNGKGTETWTPDSNLLQLLVSIQGLILVREPYYNEAGYERQRGTLEGSENSRNYNEMAVLKLVQSMTRLVKHPPSLFAEQIKEYCDAHAPRMIDRLERWINVSLESSAGAVASLPDSRFQPPDFPLLPASKGFCLSLKKAIESYKQALSLK